MVRLKCLLFEETLARVLRAFKKITFCFTGAIEILLEAVVRRPISPSPRFLFLLSKNISLDNFLSYFKDCPVINLLAK